MKELKEDWVHIRLRPTEKAALEKMAASRGTDLSKLVRGMLVEICVEAGLLRDPAINDIGPGCAVCGSLAAQPVELSNGTTLRLCPTCAPLFTPERRREDARGSRVPLSIGQAVL